MQWSENLPDQCPPSTAISPEGFVVYRLCNSSLPSEDDFKSFRALNPNSINKMDECTNKALSVWDSLEKCLDLLKLPTQKGKSTMKIELKDEDGLILKTFKQNHYSWWKAQSFDINTVTVI